MQQNGERVQEVVIAPLKDVHHADQAAAHVSSHLHLHRTIHYLHLGICQSAMKCYNSLDGGKLA